MHHSRNSQQKAWDETLVLALAGMGKLLKGHFQSIATMPDFSQVIFPMYTHMPAERLHPKYPHDPTGGWLFWSAQIILGLCDPAWISPWWTVNPFWSTL